jgi:hypothetical protein
MKLTLLEKAEIQRNYLQLQFQNNVINIFHKNFDRDTEIIFSSIGYNYVTFEVEGIKFDATNESTIYPIRICVVHPDPNKSDRVVHNLIDVAEAVRDFKIGVV